MRYRIVSAAALLALFASCQKIEDLKDLKKNLTTVKFDLPFSQQYDAPGADSNMTIPEGGVYYSLPAQAIATNSVEALGRYNVDKSQVVSLKLKTFTQYITAGAPNFNFADTLRVYLSAPGMPEILMAYKDDIPENVDSIVFNPSDENLKDYVLNDTIYLRMAGHFNSVPKAATYKSDFTFNTATSLLKDE